MQTSLSELFHRSCRLFLSQFWCIYSQLQNFILKGRIRLLKHLFILTRLYYIVSYKILTVPKYPSFITYERHMYSIRNMLYFLSYFSCVVSLILTFRFTNLGLNHKIMLIITICNWFISFTVRNCELLDKMTKSSFLIRKPPQVSDCLCSLFTVYSVFLHLRCFVNVHIFYFSFCCPLLLPSQIFGLPFSLFVYT